MELSACVVRHTFSYVRCPLEAIDASYPENPWTALSLRDRPCRVRLRGCLRSGMHIWRAAHRGSYLDPRADVDARTYLDPDAASHGNCDLNALANCNSDSYGYSSADSYGYRNPNANCDSYPDPDGYSYTNPHGHSHAYGYTDRHAYAGPFDRQASTRRVLPRYGRRIMG